MKIYQWKKSIILTCCISFTCLVAAPGAFATTVAPGLNLGAAYIQDLFSDLDGGRRRGTAAPGIIDLSAGIDGRAWGGSADDQFFFDYLFVIGGSISDEVGDLQGLDNIEAYDTTKVYSAWYQHDFGDSGIMVRLGLQDWNGLFDYVDAAGVFINSSFGLDATTAISNVSQFPTTALGAVVRWQSSNGVYAMGGVYDGVPGLPGHPAGTRIALRSGDGVFSSAEVGISGDNKPYKLAAGGWYQTSDYEDLAGRLRENNHGFYVIGQERLFGGPKTPKLDVFVQFSRADSDRNPLNRYLGAGIDLTGLLPARPNDILGLAVARAHASTIYRKVTPGSDHAETVVELTYQAPINDHLRVEPDVQYIINPGVDRALDNAMVVGIRAQLAW